MTQHRVLAGFALAAALFAGGGCAGVLHPAKSASQLGQLLRSETTQIDVDVPGKLGDLFRTMADRFGKSGKPQLASFFEAQAEGAFGSGLLVNVGGDVFVVTNHHVVDFVNEAKVRFDSSDTNYPVEVLYADDKYDLAILTFVGARPKERGLELSTTPAHDLDNVFASGFPGLDDKPSYQTTHGQVSNERFAGADGEPGTFIQHTAPIDPGSSGGPLVNDRGEVVGINTLKYTGRDNVYLAIPVDIVRRVLATAGDTKKNRTDLKWLVKKLGEACQSFVDAMRTEDEPGDALVNLVTNDLVADRGFDSLDKLDEKNDKETWEAFFDAPEASLRAAVAMRLWKEAHGKAGLPVQCLDAGQKEGEDGVRLAIQFERGRRETLWSFEQGHWRLSRFDRLSTKGARPKTKG